MLQSWLTPDPRSLLTLPLALLPVVPIPLILCVTVGVLAAGGARGGAWPPGEPHGGCGGGSPGGRRGSGYVRCARGPRAGAAGRWVKSPQGDPEAPGAAEGDALGR